MEHGGHLYETVYNKLLEKINSGEIKSGEKLPSEKELTEIYGVSRITTQKAMNMLASQGIIVRHPRLGSFVREEAAAPEVLEVGAVKEEKAVIKCGELIGLVMEDFSDSYGIELFRAIEAQAAKLGYHLCVKRSMGQQDIEKEAIDQLLALGAKGILIMPTHGNHYNTQILKLVVEGYPVVFIDRYLSGIPASYVGTDNKKAAEELTEYLTGMGHRDIVLISAPATAAVTLSDRIEGFESACRKKGILFNENRILGEIKSTIPNLKSLDNTQADMARIEEFLTWHNKATAVFTTEYHIADMVKTVCAKIGKKVPEDISIVCFDGPVSLHKSAFFTHIRQNEQEIGETAVCTLRDLLGQKPPQAPVNRCLDAALIEGNSVKRIV